MPKTARHSSKNSASPIRKRGAKVRLPLRVDEDLPPKIRHLGGIIHNLQNAAGDGNCESPEEKRLAKTIEQMFQQFGRLQHLVFATSPKRGDLAALRAHAEIAEFWCADEIAACSAGGNDAPHMLRELLKAVFAFCGANEPSAHGWANFSNSPTSI